MDNQTNAFYFVLKIMCMRMGGDLGGLGERSPQNLRWGTVHVSVSPIFREVILLDASESTN